MFCKIFHNTGFTDQISWTHVGSKPSGNQAYITRNKEINLANETVNLFQVHEISHVINLIRAVIGMCSILCCASRTHWMCPAQGLLRKTVSINSESGQVSCTWNSICCNKSMGFFILFIYFSGILVKIRHADIIKIYLQHIQK